jgi:transcription elongation factor GreA
MPIIEDDDIITLTEEGHKRMMETLEHLKTEHRAEIRERMANVEKGSEMSEDPEYEEIKKDQSILEGRIAHLENILARAKVLSKGEISTERVGIGSKVIVENLKNKKSETYEILSTMESDPAKGRISDICPVGRALMRAKKGDVVFSQTPSGRIRYLVKDIKR